MQTNKGYLKFVSQVKLAMIISGDFLVSVHLGWAMRVLVWGRSLGELQAGGGHPKELPGEAIQDLE